MKPLLPFTHRSPYAFENLTIAGNRKGNVSCGDST
jgi:hypothetical protein